MRILVLSFYYVPDLSAGSFRTTALVKELSNKLNSDDQIEVITTWPNRYSTFRSDTKEYEVVDNISIHRVKLPGHKSGMFDQAKAFTRFYKQAIKLTRDGDYDLVYATSSRLFTAFLGARIARTKNLPLFLDIRDIFVDTLNDVLSKKVMFFARPALNFIEKYTFNTAKQINLVSRGFEEYFKCRYPGAIYSYYTNGIDQEFIDLKVSNIRPAGKLKTIVYAGNIGEGQGLHKILPELANLTKNSFQIKVYGDGGLKSQLLEEVDNLHLNNFECNEPVARQELIEIYRHADVLFLHLNDYNAFKKVLPSKIFEYAAVGKPILAGVSGYAAEFISTEINNAEIFSPCNAKAAAASLSKLSIENTDRSSFLKKYARKNIMINLANEIFSMIERES